jgi:GDSL-like Lipase/Acylhydrolase family
MKKHGSIAAVVALGAACFFAYGAGAAGAEAPGEVCDVPQSFVESELELPHILTEIKDKHRLDISVIGTGSSALAGSEGPRFAYPARLDESLKARLKGAEIKVTAHAQAKATTAAMLAGMGKILSDDRPALVIWQAGTADALSGIETEDFRASLDEGVAKIQAAGADVILMNMQYSPRTESMLDVSAYADVMRVVAQQRGAVLFDRLALMHYWNDQGTFDLYTATKKYDMARRVHDCIGRALASQIINAAHLDAVRMQTTR